MRRVFDINNNWYFKAAYEEGLEKEDGIKDYERVNLPHSNVELPYNYFDEGRFQKVSFYKYPLKLEEEDRGKLVYIRFEGVMAYARVYVNGKYAGEHKGGYTPFDIRADEFYDFDSETNELSVVVDSTERDDIPPFGGQIDYLTYGGIYREVKLMIFDDIFIRNIKIEPYEVLAEEKGIKLFVHVSNLKNIEGMGQISVAIKKKGGQEVCKENFTAELNRDSHILEFELKGLRNIKLWDIDDPNLYELTVMLEVEGHSDECTSVFGFRSVKFTNEGFYLNGRKLKLRGLNRHQSYPYVGYAMPRRAQEKDADILKNELHLNLVRTSHYPQSVHFLNKCDELGLLVFEEIPGWQHIGDEEWKSVAKENVREMIERDWNHPSIILWGVRINESPDDDAFYGETNRIAHELDRTRQTGGVRCIADSKLLEDVYTFNDFNHDGIQAPLRNQQTVTGLETKVPYMVTEFNGHMYPTKRFDHEERQMEHSLRHLRVQNASYMDESISGAIGWCAFDYNTHKDFGSGDRICYHGVMDMFRLPKFAASMYGSQISPETEPVLSPVTFWARGERNIGGVIPLVIFTNCDYIEFKYGPYQSKKVYPARAQYKGIPYPPVIIDYSIITPEEAGAWGMQWEDAVITGFYKNKPVIERKLCKDPVPTELHVAPDDIKLSSSQKDATRIVVKILDQQGNLLPFIDDIIEIKQTGPARILGPASVSVKGGAIAFWVETINEPGEVNITVTSQILGEKNVVIQVE